MVTPKAVLYENNEGEDTVHTVRQPDCANSWIFGQSVSRDEPDHHIARSLIAHFVSHDAHTEEPDCCARSCPLEKQKKIVFHMRNHRTTLKIERAGMMVCRRLRARVYCVSVII